MASVITFTLVFSTAAVCLLAFETQYKCANLGVSDIPDGYFYLKLSDAELEINDTAMSVGDSSTCPADDQRVTYLDCMCGQKLRDQQTAIQERLNRSCEYYEEHTRLTSASPLGFCHRSLTQLGKCVTFEPSSDDANSTIGVFNESSLQTKMDEINRILLGYFGVLDRTLVGVYIRSIGHRCQCLEYYKRWLCATKLIFFRPPPGSSNANGSSTFDSSSNDTGSNVAGSRGPGDSLRPCIGVCEDVLQICPYYQPSRFQSKKPTNCTPNPEPETVIYGGYPAFDCPRVDFCGRRKDCAYSFHPDCFGPRGSHGSILTSSFTLIVLQLLLLSHRHFL